MKRWLILGAGMLALVIAVVVVIAAYGGGGGGGYSSGSSEPATKTATATVSTRTIGNEGAVLVDAAGRALYAADQETAAGKVLCNEACLSFWMPLTANGETPMGRAVSGKLDVAKRPDGSKQVTLDGKRLYSFVEDQPGEVTGDGFEDAFDGQTFTWHVVHAGGNTNPSDGERTNTGPFGY